MNQATLLEESEVKYKLLVESIKDYAIFMLSPEGIITTWNKGAENLKGYTAQEIKGKHFSKFYTNEDLQNGYPNHELEVAKKEGKFEIDGWRVKKNGDKFWANILITPIYNSSNVLVGFAKVTKDLTQVKQLQDEILAANDQLKKSEQVHRTLIEGVKDYAIFMITPEGKVATWNAGAERIKGYQASEIIGQHFSKFYPEEARNSQFPEFELKKSLEEGRFEDEGWRVKKDGSTFWANVIITPLFSAGNKHIGFSKITRDLSERVKNEELRNKNQQLLKINTDLDNFVYTASHDLKAPISNLEGLLNLFSRKIASKIEPSEQSILKMMNASLHRLKRTISDLTEVIKVQKEDNTDVEKINLHTLIKEVKVDLYNSIEESKVKIEEHLEVNEILFASRNLRSIVYNLLSNAIKYRAPDRPLKIDISSSQTSDYTIISVTDNGLGLSKDNKEKLFTLFKRFHKHVEGTGIGLYIVKRILENSGGKIEVKSEVNKGTEFKLYLKR